ncbi:hypothetical protein [Sphingomonas sp.]|uniref:hypothetical protein n=1 Tax=Sphingomonas sp. TaxID=28214 RepID=UPI001B0E9356|nr:hypothetical protein [Sphingomonas sp.]MBO9715011.1 hypothetical protein [Sphingomonas sp.]
MSDKPTTHHILASASNLLAITLVIIAGLHVTGRAARTIADEIAWLSALCFTASCWLSYLSIRTDRDMPRAERVADVAFMGGLSLLTVAVFALAFLRGI